MRDASFMVALEAHTTRGRGARVHLASAIEPDWLLEIDPARVRDERRVIFDDAEERVLVKDALVYDGLVLDETVSRSCRDATVSEALRAAALEAGVARFCDLDTWHRWKARFEVAAKIDPGVPVLEESALQDALESLCEGRLSFAELESADPLSAALFSLDPKARARVESLAPDKVRLHEGREARVIYEPGQAPMVASRLQDFFGRAKTPTIGEGRVPLLLHLLAPNQRALQVTTDLAGFWERHYPALRTALMRRYPRHAWPERPQEASPPPRGRTR